MADRFGDRLEVVALGPLTNLALALERGRERLLRIRRLVVMGGAVAVPGNVTPAAEFNVYVDPEAAALVLGAGLPVELIPLDVTRQVMLPREALERALEGRPGPVADLVAAFTPHGFDVAAARGDAGIVLHDPLAVAVALDPTLVGFDDLHLEVECEGRLTRGLTLADRRTLPAAERPRPNCRVATAVDADGVGALLLGRLCGPPAASP
jgi:purine nucleosidase/pyrimidine-specific ribonucleoside hydrolase